MKYCIPLQPARDGSRRRLSASQFKWRVLTFSLFGGSLIATAQPNLSGPDVIIMDNGAPGSVAIGDWPASNVTGTYGLPSVTDNNVGKGTKSYRYTPTLTTSGLYEVYARWAAHANRSASTPIDVTFSGGLHTATVNQQQNGGAWNSLGIFPFDAGSSGNVLVRTTGTTGYVSTDAVVFEKRGELDALTDIILDNMAGTAGGVVFTGSWGVTGAVGGYYGTNFHHDSNNGKGSKSARYTPTLPSAGSYEVYARWSAYSNRATNTPIDITHMGGTSTVTLNQREDGSQWRLLGTYPFEAGTAGNVLIRNGGTDGFVIADAFRFLKITPAPVTEVIVDSSAPAHSAYVTKVGTWGSSTSVQGFHGTDYLHDQNTGRGTKSVTFTPVLPATGSYDVYTIWTTDVNRANNVPVQINHAGGTATVTVNQRVNGAAWRLLGTYDFAAGNTGSVSITNTGTNGFVVADAVLFDLREGEPVEPNFVPFFVDDFEARAVGSLLPRPYDAQGRTRVSTEQAYRGQNSVRMEVHPEDGAAFGPWGAVIHTRPVIRKGGEIWARMHVYWPESFLFTATPWMKLLRIHTTEGLTGENRGYNDLYIHQANSTQSVLRSIREIHNQWQIYDGHPIPRGRWERYEMYLYLDDKSVDDGGKGRFRVWRDNELIFDRTDIPTLIGAPDYVDQINIFTYWNNENPPFNYCYVDDIAIATNASPPPKRDAAGNKFIGDWMP